MALPANAIWLLLGSAFLFGSIGLAIAIVWLNRKGALAVPSPAESTTSNQRSQPKVKTLTASLGETFESVKALEAPWASKTATQAKAQRVRRIVDVIEVDAESAPLVPAREPKNKGKSK